MTKNCERCGGEFTAQRRTARFCSPACKKAGQRARRAEECTVVTEFRGQVERATHEELAARGMLESVPGAVALVLARLMDRAGPASGSSVAAWSKELSRALAESRQQSEARREQDDPLTRLRAQVRARRDGLNPVE
jgi:hypothetical protein